MSQPDPIILREIPLIEKIVSDETWLEGERRGCYVSSDDPGVSERVCEVIFCIGQQLRDQVIRERAESAVTAYREAG